MSNEQRVQRSPLRTVRALVATTALIWHGVVLAQTHSLNDTGQIICYNATVGTGTVSAGSPDPEAAGLNRQDCTQGRAAGDAVGALYKLGGSTRAGADYTRIANNGSELPASAALGGGGNDWACTRDNVTGLIWEVKLNDPASLRYRVHTYTWYDTDAAVNGGDPGNIGTNSTCTALSNCNTTAYRDAVNAAGMCGASDWRLPRASELQSLVHYGRSTGPLIDITWFPNTFSNFHVSGQTDANNTSLALIVGFQDGSVTAGPKSTGHRIRLVRGAP